MGHGFNSESDPLPNEGCGQGQRPAKPDLRIPQRRALPVPQADELNNADLAASAIWTAAIVCQRVGPNNSYRRCEFAANSRRDAAAWAEAPAFGTARLRTVRVRAWESGFSRRTITRI